MTLVVQQEMDMRHVQDQPKLQQREQPQWHQHRALAEAAAMLSLSRMMQPCWREEGGISAEHCRRALATLTPA
ncbi:hypothetical protein [Aphanothece microscopica]|uniref:hypothetical protein n=1 Tax=Aphanothece microscopica TaxID=1049561 RepID=UPI00398530E5